MKYFFLLIIGSLIFDCATAQTKSDTLTNENVVSLLDAGLQPTIVITKIINSNTNFDVTIDGLIDLNRRGVPDTVISAMINPSNYKEKLNASNDNVSLFKKWKEVSLIMKNGVRQTDSRDVTIEFYEDGTYKSSFIGQNRVKIDDTGKYSLENDNKVILFHLENGGRYASSIIKLTNSELELKSEESIMIYRAK